MFFVHLTLKVYGFSNLSIFNKSFSAIVLNWVHLSTCYNIAMSSTKRMTLSLQLHLNRSLTYRLKRIGPKAEPWGTPFSIFSNTLWVTLIETRWELFRKKLLINFVSSEWIYPPLIHTVLQKQYCPCLNSLLLAS